MPTLSTNDIDVNSIVVPPQAQASGKPQLTNADIDLSSVKPAEGVAKQLARGTLKALPVAGGLLGGFFGAAGGPGGMVLGAGGGGFAGKALQQAGEAYLNDAPLVGDIKNIPSDTAKAFIEPTKTGIETAAGQALGLTGGKALEMGSKAISDLTAPGTQQTINKLAFQPFAKGGENLFIDKQVPSKIQPMLDAVKSKADQAYQLSQNPVTRAVIGGGLAHKVGLKSENGAILGLLASPATLQYAMKAGLLTKDALMNPQVQSVLGQYATKGLLSENDSSQSK